MSGQQQQQDGPWEPFVFGAFDGGLNTLASRPGLEDKDLAICDGFMPAGPSKLRTMPGAGAAIFTAVGPTVVTFAFGQVGAEPICAVVLTDGSIWRVDLNIDTGTLVGAPGTISGPTIASVGFSQWGAAFMVIVAPQANGYWFLDSTSLYGPGTLAPGVNLTAGGSGYSGATAAASGGSGSGATFSVTTAGGVVTSVTMLSPGSGYHVGDVVTLAISGGGGTGAHASVALMPFGVQGTTVQVYQSRVWVASGANVFFTAPQSAIDFSTANGGGSFTSNDSFLKTFFAGLVQTNGFLYLIADSSINYISNVQTSGSPAVTTFTNQNADPEMGTPYPASITTFGSNIAIANSVGVHLCYGGRVIKASENLDGIWTTVAGFGGNQISSAKATVFGKKCLVVLATVLDQSSGAQGNKLFLWDEKRWWSTQQDKTINFIAPLEGNSVFTAYGTDGVTIFPLFTTATTGFAKTARSKLSARPQGYAYQKATNRLWVLGQYASTASPNLTVGIDNETQTAQQVLVLTPGTPAINGSVYVSPPTATGQVGALLGMTIVTSAADFTLISAMIDAVPVGYRG